METSSSEPRNVSVVIPTIEREEVLSTTLRDLLSQDFEDYEILIIDQSEKVNEQVLAIARNSGSVPVRYFKADFKGLPEARNFGWQNARNDIVLYIDDDIRTNSELVRAHLQAHLDSGATMVAGRVDESGVGMEIGARTGDFRWWSATPVGNFSDVRAGWCTHVKGCNFSIRRNVVEALGGIDQVLNVGAALYEELELSLRHHSAGLRTWFEPSAHLRHLAAPAGGCRVTNDWPKYAYGLAHNRGIIIHRHLNWWHRPTAILRLFLLGVSYSRVDGSLTPLWSTVRGWRCGRLASAQPPLLTELSAQECTT